MHCPLDVRYEIEKCAPLFSLNSPLKITLKDVLQMTEIKQYPKCILNVTTYTRFFIQVYF